MRHGFFRSLLKAILFSARVGWPAFVCTGCLLVPTHVEGLRQDLGHTPIDGRALGLLHPGVSTRAQVTQDLGDPTLVFRNPRLVAYTWLTSGSAKFLMVGLFFGGTKEFEVGGEDTHYLVLEFDSRDILTRFTTRDGGTLDVFADSLDRAFKR